mmetsp:Transcript_10674/g.25797  ORF Transcript_10674/g.25797 Transcript_10674/m.25797 type:complete len:222 (-) Transcript_10674:34-699(-)
MDFQGFVVQAQGGTSIENHFLLQFLVLHESRPLLFITILFRTPFCQTSRLSAGKNGTFHNGILKILENWIQFCKEGITLVHSVRPGGGLKILILLVHCVFFIVTLLLEFQVSFKNSPMGCGYLVVCLEGLGGFQGGKGSSNLFLELHNASCKELFSEFVSHLADKEDVVMFLRFLNSVLSACFWIDSWNATLHHKKDQVSLYCFVPLLETIEKICASSDRR